MQTSVRIDSTGVSISAPTAQVQIFAAASVEVTAPALNVNTAIATFSGVVQCPVYSSHCGGRHDLHPGGGQRMVKHDILVRGVDMTGTEQKPPVLLQMNDDDFPGRFLKDLASPGQPPISSAKVVNGSTLFQPVQRILNVASGGFTKCNS